MAEHTHIRSAPLVGEHPLLDVVRGAVSVIAKRAEYLEADLDWAAITISEVDSPNGKALEVIVPIREKD